MNRIISIPLTAIIIATSLTLSCSGDDGGDETGKQQGSTSETDPSSSSGEVVVEPKCGGVAYDPETHFCLANGMIAGPETGSGTVTPKCGGLTYNADKFCLDDVVTPKCGTATYTANEFCLKNEVVPKCQATTTNEFCDVRDNKLYKLVTIGTGATAQTWMAENLNYEADGSVCYDNNPTNCDTYGRLYDWETAMNNSASSTASPSEVQGVCPTGWHLPSDAEWTALNHGFLDLLGGLLGGVGLLNDSFYDVDLYGYWWSSSEIDSYYAYIRYMIYSNVIRDRSDKVYLLSVRCVQDQD